jgi:hypothetical protein
MIERGSGDELFGARTSSDVRNDQAERRDGARRILYAPDALLHTRTGFSLGETIMARALGLRAIEMSASAPATAIKSS